MLFLAAGSTVTSLNSIQAADTVPFFGNESDIKFAKALWKSMEENSSVGDNAINVYPFKGNQPHGAIQQVLDTDIAVNGRASRVTVKRKHGGKDITVKSIYADPVSNLKAVTVMYKREAGYDSDDLDWFWVKYTPEGAIDKNPKGMKMFGRIGKDGSGGCLV
ncbi:MAG: hypothetical protein GY703_23225 [Gammaproteobacteria bacterium]|nr:hypothetical protein [Gammaproteobacteria bacterium]